MHHKRQNKTKWWWWLLDSIIWRGAEKTTWWKWSVTWNSAMGAPPTTFWRLNLLPGCPHKSWEGQHFIIHCLLGRAVLWEKGVREVKFARRNKSESIPNKVGLRAPSWCCDVPASTLIGSISLVRTHVCARSWLWDTSHEEKRVERHSLLQPLLGNPHSAALLI